MTDMKEYIESGAAKNLATLLSAVHQADNSQTKFDQSAQVNFLRNFSIEPIESYLKYHLYQAKIQPHIAFGDYDNVDQEILDPQSHLYRSAPDLVVLSLMLEQLDPAHNKPGWKAAYVKDKLLNHFDQLASKTRGLIAVNTFPPPYFREQGIAGNADGMDRESQIISLNQFIRGYVREHASRFFVIDWERILRILGEEESMDYRYWYLFKAPFKKKFLDLYAFEITKILRALKGKSKKCLVLDCDNTLWGGVVGEDGLHEIKLDPNEYPGNVFYEFQKTVLHLFERGVLITLCSKNNEQDVWEVLDKHPHCLIKRSHLAGWRINWENKANNINSLARELNIGLDSFVLVDDDPVECELVKKLSAEVTVMQVPAKLYSYPPILHKCGLFDTLSISEEDKKRTALYQAETRRRDSHKQFESIDDFLASLNLTAQIHPVQPQEIGRVAQLTQKTNQFNLTTRRYSKPEIEGLAGSSSVEIFTLSVKDKFSDSGLTGVLIARCEDGEGRIDSLLLSCRILGRQLEMAFVDDCLTRLEKKWNLNLWKAEYLPTKKNGQVADFWDRIGFKIIKGEGNGKSYAVHVNERKTFTADFIKIIRE